jgi:hypothetical protein
MPNTEKIKIVLERLTGQLSPIKQSICDYSKVRVFEGCQSLGYSQLNELLLIFGLDRMTQAFFQYLLDGETNYNYNSAFSSIDRLEKGVDRFIKLAILHYGNVKYAYKELSRDIELLENYLISQKKLPDERFFTRHKAIFPLQTISPEDAYLTGYLIQDKIKQSLIKNPEDDKALDLQKKCDDIVKIGKENHHAYLASDHLDVYVATSMREPHEFRAISRICNEIFNHRQLATLQLRWFDPTQAYCSDRIDKGLSEALMLRRATCTIYLAQENDTLGKDSELASTLAQGKPVIAYVPTINKQYINIFMDDLSKTQPEKTFIELMIEQLKIFNPNAAWDDPTIRSWCEDPSKIDEKSLKECLTKSITKLYDSRAKTLKETHPLGIQVNLQTGVANGVLVVRSIDNCAKLVKKIVKKSLELEIEKQNGYTILKEKISGCIFRVMTEDEALTNTFWNFYIDPVE